MDYLKIDGSFGEGGGQIVRTAITLSCIINKPVLIENIRKGRKKPGLKPQHVTSLKILKKICNAEIDNLKIGAQSLCFVPHSVNSLDLNEDVGTAGSISLILQVLIPIIALTKKKLKLRIKGGTNVLWSPTIDYTNTILGEVYSRMGINFSIKLIKRGYYPKGGGIVDLTVEPSEKIYPLILNQRKTKSVELICSYSQLPDDLIENKIKEIEKTLIQKKFIVQKEIKNESALNSGASLLLSSIDKESIIGVDSVFDEKKQEFPFNLEEFIQNKLSVDENLADMIVVPASLVEGLTIFQVKKISKHLETNLFIASKITGCKYGIGKLKDGYEVRIEGISHSSVK